MKIVGYAVHDNRGRLSFRSTSCFYPMLGARAIKSKYNVFFGYFDTEKISF